MKLTPLSGPIKTQVEIPGSKSYTNRALVLAALAGGGKILRPLESDDTKAMTECLTKLGVRISQTKDEIVLENGIEAIQNKEYELDADLSGTTIRFMLALACAVPGVKILKGKEGLNKRPIGDLVDALRQLGAKIEFAESEGFPPLRVTSTSLNSGTVRISGAISSQFASALLMVAPLHGATIEVEGEQISKPYIDMTLDTMRRFGVVAENEGYKRYVVPQSKYSRKEYSVEGDASSAAYFAAIAALTGSTITLGNMNPDSEQADMRFLKILGEMGNVVSYGKNEITVEGKGVRAIEVDMEGCPDQAQTLAVLAAFAPGKTVMTGIRSLRVKETERAAALEAELAKMGIKTESTNDTLTIYGGSPVPAAIDTYGDHRMAMAFAVAGAKLPGMVINDPGVVSKTFPGFWDILRSIGVGAQ